MKNGLIGYSVIVFLIISAQSCQKHEGSERAGHIAVRFHHHIDGNPLVVDEMRYTNKAGNRYEVNEIQWFISDLTFHMKDGGSIALDQESFAHYVDTDIPASHLWIIQQDIPEGAYEAISMTFGLKGEKNTPYLFTDSPESEMIWPINLGGENGGYHYMKLNGFWINAEAERTPFNFHLGVGQQKDNAGEVTAFVQNWFEAFLSESDFTMEKGDKKVINLVMNVDQWFNGPNIYNHDIHGAKIMQNQAAMKMGTDNGKSGVFTIKSIEKVNNFDGF